MRTNELNPSYEQPINPSDQRVGIINAAVIAVDQVAIQTLGL